MADRVGQQLGNYRLVRWLGKGGFAEVYLGEHVYLKVPAAIKVLQMKVVTQEDLEGFLKEAQTIAQLVHPHIVRVLEFGLDGETPFLVMDYATGGTLRQRHPKGTQLPMATIVAYVKQVADALHYAHTEKLIHRDLKPENMLLGRRNEVLLSDFGIAIVAQSSHVQSTQEVVGTITYMSPEQIQGKPRPASDQYSLGVVVYEWLSGKRPFHGSFTELCTQHMFAPPPPLHEIIPTIPPAVEQVVMTALAKDPKQRFGSVLAFATALEQASQDFSDIAILRSQPPVSHSPMVVLSQPQQLIEPITPPRQVADSPTELVTPESQSSLPTKSDLPLKASSISSDRMFSRKQPKQTISRFRVPLLVGLALIVIAGSIGLFSIIRTNQINNAHLAATTTANTHLTATSQAFYGSATAIIGAATATAKAMNQLPTPKSFQTLTITGIGVSVKSPSDWQQIGPQATSSNDMEVALVPPQQIGIAMFIKRISASNSANLTSPVTANQENINEFSKVSGVNNLQPTVASQPTIAGVQWSEQDATFKSDQGDNYHYSTIAVLHSNLYYTISFYIPDVYHDEAMQKYIQPILDSFQFLS